MLLMCREGNAQSVDPSLTSFGSFAGPNPDCNPDTVSTNHYNIRVSTGAPVNSFYIMCSQGKAP